MLRIAAVIAAAVAVMGVATSYADYPKTPGSTTCTVSDDTPVVDSNVTVMCLVRDTEGSPIAGQDVTFGIGSEPGQNAAVGSKVVIKTTDSNGVATTNLYTGTDDGVIIVDIKTGSLTSRVYVIVEEAASPPAAPLDPVITPPSTGDAGLAS